MKPLFNGKRAQCDRRAVFFLCAALWLLSVCRATRGSDFVWETLPPLPDPHGFAGAYAGVTRGVLVVAGGANFPDKKPWENGTKVWHDRVFALERPDAAWRIVGRLPRVLGYGVSVSSKRGVICVGGNNADGPCADSFILTVAKGVARTEPLPSLPIPLANAAGALLEETVYVCGGSDQPGERTALNRLFVLDLSKATRGWRELEACWGRARILPVAAALDGAFYWVGGVALETANGHSRRVYLRDGWRYHPRRGWEQIADLPKPAAAAPSPAPVFGARFFVVGGDDGSLVGFEPMERHPGFPRTVLGCDTIENEWIQAGEVAVSRAAVPAVWWRDRYVLLSGEVRPGVRSPAVWTMRSGRSVREP